MLKPDFDILASLGRDLRQSIQKTTKEALKMTVLFSIFKLLLKIAAAPVIAILALFVWFCTWLVCVSGAVLGLVSLLLCVCSAFLFLSSSVAGGIIYLVLAFLASPFGLPMMALWLLSKVQDLKVLIQDLIYG